MELLVAHELLSSLDVGVLLLAPSQSPEDLHDLPALVEFVQARQIPVVHLVRSNVFAQHVSLLWAGQLQTWEVSRNEPLPTGKPIVVDLAWARLRMEKARKEITSVRRW